MLASKYRFHGHGSLSYVYRKGRIERSRLFIVRMTPNRFRDKSRFAVVVSKKTHKSAVGRNRIRRRVYELIRQELPHISRAYDVVIHVKSAEAISLPHQQMQQELTDLFRQLHLYDTAHR